MDAASFGITQVEVAHAGINWGLLKIESLISCGSKAANTESSFLFPLIHQNTFTSTSTFSHLVYSALRLAGCSHWICSPWERMVSKPSCCDFYPFKVDMMSMLDGCFSYWSDFQFGMCAGLSNSLKVIPVDLPLTLCSLLIDQSYLWCSGIDGTPGWWLWFCWHWCQYLPTFCPSSKHRKERVEVRETSALVEDTYSSSQGYSYFTDVLVTCSCCTQNIFP